MQTKTVNVHEAHTHIVQLLALVTEPNKGVQATPYSVRYAPASRRA